jgi:hypothetical protein
MTRVKRSRCFFLVHLAAYGRNVLTIETRSLVLRQALCGRLWQTRKTPSLGIWDLYMARGPKTSKLQLNLEFPGWSKFLPVNATWCSWAQCVTVVCSACAVWNSQNIKIVAMSYRGETRLKIASDELIRLIPNYDHSPNATLRSAFLQKKIQKKSPKKCSK